MGLKTTCDSCGAVKFASLTEVKGKYLCPLCASNPEGKAKYYCNACHNYAPHALRKGSGWIEVVLYLFYIVPGVIYSIWRRAGPPTVCPLCRATALVPASAAKPTLAPAPSALGRDEVECPYCAERILARAKVCKHCGKQVRSEA